MPGLLSVDFTKAPGLGGSDFDPRYITSLKQWVEARLETGFSDGDAVGTATDFSGNSNHLSQTTAGSKPTFKTNIVNGKPVYRFDGVDDHFTMSNILSGASAGEVFIVVKINVDPPTDANKSGLWNLDGEGTNAVNFPYTDGNLYEAWGSTSRKNTGVNPSPSLTSFRIYNVKSAASDYKILLDNTQIYTTSTNTFSSFSSGTPYLGRSNGLFGDPYLNGDIAGILQFAAVLGSTDHDYVKDNLGSIYGITVA